MTEEIQNPNKPLVTAKFTSLLNFANTIAELPLSKLQFSKVLDSTGPWSGSLNVEDKQVQKAGWLEATAENRTALWVDIGGTLLYGGPVQSRKYQLATGIATLGGADFTSYFSQRIQSRDYAEYTDPDGHHWATSGAPAARVAFFVLKQALERAYSIPIKVVTSGAEPEEKYWVTYSAPIEQMQTLSSVLSQLQELGYLIGLDYAVDYAYVNGAPTATVTLSYPRRGAVTLEPPVFDISQALDLEYDGDGTQQADQVYSQAGATYDRSSSGIWLPAREAGYPLYEVVTSHTALAPSSNTAAVLEAYVSGDLAAYALASVLVVILDALGLCYRPEREKEAPEPVPVPRVRSVPPPPRSTSGPLGRRIAAYESRP